MLREDFPTLWLCHFARAFLVFATFVFAAMRFVNEIFFARFVVRNQLVRPVADQFLPPHFRDGFAQ